MKKQIASELLKIKAVFLSPNEPFSWASGILSPIYCDNRMTLAFPTTRTIVEDGLATTIKENYPKCEVIMGTATAGIAHAALVAERMELPMGYVRSTAKAHGLSNQIEGADVKGKNVVVVEDLISTGGSVIQVVEALREAGATVLGIASIFTYGLQKGLERLEDAEVKNISLSNADALIEVATKENYIKASDEAKLKAFFENPTDPAWMKK